LVYKRYESPFEEKPKPQSPKPPPLTPPPEKPKQKQVSLGFLDNLSTDDILIIALIIILLSAEKEKRDVPMILTLGFLFLIQYIDND